MKNTKALLAVFALLSASCAYALPSVSYIDKDGVTQTITSYTAVDSNLPGVQYWTTGTYVVGKDYNGDGKIDAEDALVTGAQTTFTFNEYASIGQSSAQFVEIVLADGFTLEMKSSMNVSCDSTAEIYGQKEGTGRLISNSMVYMNSCGITIPFSFYSSNLNCKLHIYGGNVFGYGGKSIGNYPGKAGAEKFKEIIVGNGSLTLVGGEPGIAAYGNGAAITNVETVTVSSMLDVKVGADTNTMASVSFEDGENIAAKVNKRYLTISVRPSKTVVTVDELGQLEEEAIEPINNMIRSHSVTNMGAVDVAMDMTNNITFAQIKEKPDTLAGYGITNAYTKGEVDDGFVAKSGENEVNRGFALYEEENQYSFFAYYEDTGKWHLYGEADDAWDIKKDNEYALEYDDGKWFFRNSSIRSTVYLDNSLNDYIVLGRNLTAATADKITAPTATNISASVTSNIVTKSYVEGLGIEAGINEQTATNIASSAAVTNMGAVAYANDKFVTIQGAQAIDGAKTFNGGLQVKDSTAVLTGIDVRSKYSIGNSRTQYADGKIIMTKDDGMGGAKTTTVEIPTDFFNDISGTMALKDDVKWGKITGTLGDQTDLSTALNGKANKGDIKDYVDTYYTINPYGGASFLWYPDSAGDYHYDAASGDYVFENNGKRYTVTEINATTSVLRCVYGAYDDKVYFEKSGPYPKYITGEGFNGTFTYHKVGFQKELVFTTADEGKVLGVTNNALGWVAKGIQTVNMDDIVDGTTYKKTHNDYTTAEKESVANTATGLSTHTARTDNPHSVTAAQLGALTSESDPTVSAWAKAATKPTYTAAEVGLGNVNNTSDANKPISLATQNALAQKQDLLPTTIPSYYLHSNSTTGELEWYPAGGGSGGVEAGGKGLQADAPTGYDTRDLLRADTVSKAYQVGHYKATLTAAESPTGSAQMGFYKVADLGDGDCFIDAFMKDGAQYFSSRIGGTWSPWKKAFNRTGDTMSGNLGFSQQYARIGGCSSFDMMSKLNDLMNSYIWLSTNGIAQVRAGDGTNTKDLIMKSDGTIMWNGRYVCTAADANTGWETLQNGAGVTGTIQARIHNGWVIIIGNEVGYSGTDSIFYPCVNIPAKFQNNSHGEVKGIMCSSYGQEFYALCWMGYNSDTIACWRTRDLPASNGRMFIMFPRN